jgi:AAA domain (dynein-related subfamily)
MSSTTIEKKLIDAIHQAQRSVHRLVLLVGPSGAGKTEMLRRLADSHGCPYLNVNLHLSQRMLELPRNRRPRQVDHVFNALVDDNEGGLLVLDNLEVLFDPSLQLDPLRLLKAVSRKQTLVAAWNGTLNNGALSYAEPDHPEFKLYRDVDVLVVSVPQEVTASH